MAFNDPVCHASEYATGVGKLEGMKSNVGDIGKGMEMITWLQCWPSLTVIPTAYSERERER